MTPCIMVSVPRTWRAWGKYPRQRNTYIISEHARSESVTMKLTQKQLRKMILEEVENMLDHEFPDEVEAEEDAWAGGEDLDLPIDHLKAGGGPTIEDSPGMTDIVGDVKLGESAKRLSGFQFHKLVHGLIQEAKTDAKVARILTKK